MVVYLQKQRKDALPPFHLHNPNQVWDCLKMGLHFYCVNVTLLNPLPLIAKPDAAYLATATTGEKLTVAEKRQPLR